MNALTLGGASLFLLTGCGAPQATTASPEPAPPPPAPTELAAAPRPKEPLKCEKLPDPEPRSAVSSALLNQLEKAALAPPSVAAGDTPVKVGVLHALTGSMARDESMLAHTALATFESINKSGGVLGRSIEPVVVDPASNWPVTSEHAVAFHKQGVNPIFGLSTTIQREYVKRTMQAGDLLFYPAKYEGGEQAPGFYYTGAGVRQHALPAAEYFLGLGARAPRRFAFLGSDYWYPRQVGKALRALLKSKGFSEDRFLEMYVPFGHREFHTVVESIDKLADGEPTVVFTFLAHDANPRFSNYLAECKTSSVQLVSFSATRDELAHRTGRQLAGQFVGASYLSELDNPANSAFKALWRDYVTARGLPAERATVIEEAMESTFVGIQLWKRAVEAAGTFDGEKVAQTLPAQSYAAPSGYVVKLDPRTRDLYRPLFIAEVQPDRSLKLVHSSGKALPP